MGKVITSPVKRFSGEVEIPEYLNFPEYTHWRTAIHAGQEYLSQQKAKAPEGAKTYEYDLAHYNRLMMPGILAIVRRWAIPALELPVTPDNFPVIPPKASQALLNWLIREIGQLFEEADETDPK